MAVFVFLGALLAADDWPQFRGPSAGVADDAGLPTTWSPTANVAWKLDIAGRGWSSPVVAGDRIFLTAVIAPRWRRRRGRASISAGIGKRRRLAASLDGVVVDWKTGKLLWEREVHRGAAPSRHLKNSFAPKRP